MAAMKRVFISSVQDGFERVRAAAPRAVENLGFRPLMAELARAWPESPGTALLSLVCDTETFLCSSSPALFPPDRA